MDVGASQDGSVIVQVTINRCLRAFIALGSHLGGDASMLAGYAVDLCPFSRHNAFPAF